MKPPSRDQLRALERGLWTDSPDETFALAVQWRADPDRFLDAADNAWASGDAEAFVRMARILRREGGLTSKAAYQLADCLIRAWWFEEAADMLLQDASAQPVTARHWSTLATALAGSERMDQARTAAVRALDLEPELSSAVRLVQHLDEIARLETRAPNLTDSCRLIELQLSLGLSDRAAKTVVRLCREPARLNDTEIEALAQCCSGFVRYLDPETVLQMLDGLRRVAPKRDAALLERGLQVLRGLPPPDPGEPPRKRPEVTRLVALACAVAGRLEDAIELLAVLSVPFRKHNQIRYDLARYVGQRLLADLSITYRPGDGRRRVFDVFPFNGEFEMLRMRLEETSDWVDHFVLVESPWTFTGKPKPLHFQDAKADFRDWDEKIIHVVAPQPPPWVTHAWDREFYQRDIAVTALSGLCSRDDLVLLTDVDEILDRRVISRLNCAFSGLGLWTFSFFLNYCKVGKEQTMKSAAVLAKDLQHHGLSFVRFGLHQFRKQRTPMAGWHFTSIGAAEWLAAKYGSYSHEKNAAIPLSALEIQLARIREGQDEPGWERCEIDDSFQRYIRENAARLSDFIL